MAMAHILHLLLFLWAVHHVAEGDHGLVYLEEKHSAQDIAAPHMAHHDGIPYNVSNVSEWEIIPHPGMQSRLFNISRRELGSFQLCSICTCCGGPERRFCIPAACCYTITCGSPNRPFGLCSFTPISCNCFSCRL